MHISKTLALRVAVCLVAVLAPLAVAAPALAAGCRTGSPYVGVRQNRYNIVTTGIDVRRVHHFTFEVWSNSGYRVYRSPRQVIWERRLPSVFQVKGWVFFTASERHSRIGCGYARR